MNEFNLLEHKGYYGTVEFSVKDEVLYGKVVGINSLISYEGDSVQSLKADFEDAIDDYLETCAEKGVEPEKAYKGSFNIRIAPELHRKLDLYAASIHQTMNATIEKILQERIG